MERVLLAYPNLCLLKPGLGVFMQFEFSSSPDCPLCAPGTLIRHSLKGTEPFLTSGPGHVLLSLWDPRLSLPMSGTLLLPFRPGPGATSPVAIARRERSLHKMFQRKGGLVWLSEQG